MEDFYFRDRVEVAKFHRVIKTIQGSELYPQETESKLHLPDPTLQEKVEVFSYNPRSLANVIDAIENGFIRADLDLNTDMVSIEFLPLSHLPSFLGHITEMENFKRNIHASRQIFGDEDEQKFTYLQTTEFAVEGYMDDQKEGKEYPRIFIDTAKLQSLRKIYLDPESLNVTEYEYLKSFAINGGLPMSTIDHVDIVRAIAPFARGWYKKNPVPEWEDINLERQMQECAEKLKQYLLKLKTT